MSKSLPGVFALLLLVGCLNNLNAQQGIDAAGGVATGTGGSVSFSIGQIDYIDAFLFNSSVCQGLQQPVPKKESTSIAAVQLNSSAAKLDAVVYPNPAAAYVILNIQSQPAVNSVNNITPGNTANNLAYTLYSVNGKLLKAEKITGSQISISLAGIAKGAYFLVLRNNTSVLKTFTILKAQ